MANAQSFHSDSAICFSIFLHHLPSLSAVQTPQALLQAMEVRRAAAAMYVYKALLAGDSMCPVFLMCFSSTGDLRPAGWALECVRLPCRQRFTRSSQLRKLLE